MFNAFAHKNPNSFVTSVDSKKMEMVVVLAHRLIEALMPHHRQMVMVLKLMRELLVTTVHFLMMIVLRRQVQLEMA